MKIQNLGSLVLVLATLAARAFGGDAAVEQSIPVPGGLAGLIRAAELDPGLERWRVLFEASQRLHPTYGDPARAALRRDKVRAALRGAAPRLARGPVSRKAGASDAPGYAPDADQSVFLPLPPPLWRQAVLGAEVPDERLVEAVLENRDASLLYRGLVQLDEPTLRFLAGDADLVEWTCRNRADVFSVFAGSLRVREKRVAVPGGNDAESLWEDVAGESPARPDAFLKQLLARDEGRLAFFYHVAAHLPPSTLRFALASAEANREERRKRFRSLVSAFAQGPTWWRPESGAFARPLVDPAMALQVVRVQTDGQPAPPAGRAFWAAAFAGEVPPPHDLARFQRDTPFDAGWLAENVGLAPGPETRRGRLTQVAFAQRVLGAVGPGDLADALLALRGLAQKPALVLALERMGVRTPAVYAHAVRRAEQLAPVSHQGASALAQFQGSLAVLERARFSRAMEAPEVEALVVSLANVTSGEDGYAGGIARWIEESLVPVVARAVDGDQPSTSAEQTLLGAMAGDRWSAEVAAPFEWEGLWYHALPGVGERRRLRLVRDRQAGNTLDVVLGFAAAVRHFREAPDANRQARVRERAKVLDASAVSTDAREALALRDAPSARQARALTAVADEFLADTLTSLAYAPHLGAAQGSALLGANVARRHDFAGQAWDLPEEVVRAGVPWHVRGSLLALDTALARLSLRRPSGDMPTRAPVVDPRTARGFARTVALRSPFALRDEEAATIAGAIARGRERVAAGKTPGAVDTLARDAGLGALRAEGLRSSRLREADSAPDFLTLQELLRLGRPDPVPGEDWGTPDLARGGGLRLAPPHGNGVEASIGQRPEDQLAEHLSDPVLRVAVELHTRHLPASLAPGVLALFVQDLIHEAMPISPDDGLSLARFCRDWPGERFDDYVSALSGDGPLLPAAEPGGQASAP